MRWRKIGVSGTWEYYETFRGREKVGAFGVCTEQGCPCEGFMVYWGEAPTPCEFNGR